MTETWSPLCLVPACDVGRAAWPMPVAVLGDDLAVSQDGRAVALSQIAVAVSLTAEGAALFDRLEAAQPGALQGIRHAGDPVAALVAALAHSQARVARQLRELAQLREMAERSLQSFQRLEAFVWQTSKGERTLVQHLAQEGSFALTRAVQRLPGDSAGLTDVAVWIGGARGVLTARLVLAESAEVVGLWQVTDPGEGWLRLALPRALSVDAQTPMLHLDWTGEPLTLGLSLPHPDPRFQCEGGAMLALKLWKFVPGVAAPMAPEAHGTEPGTGRWLMPLAAGPLTLTDETLTLRHPIPAGLRLAQVMVSAEGAVEMALTQGAPRWQPIGAEPVTLVLHDAAPGELLLMARAKGAATLYLDPVEGFAHAR